MRHTRGERIRRAFKRYDAGFDDGFNAGLRWNDKRVQSSILERMTKDAVIMTNLDLKIFERITEIIEES